jgi:TPR repeat protein
LKWYSKAAAQGDADAQNNLASMYEEGRGVPKDLVRAHMWYSLAAASATGDVQSDAAESLGRVAAKMTPQQIAQAKEMSQRCQQSKFKNCN